MNFKFSYLYRDGSNYKNFREFVFTNKKSFEIDEIRRIITSKLIDDTWFYASRWGLPDLHFLEYQYDPNIDVDWHEFESIELTDEISDDNIDIELLLKKLKGTI